MVIVLRVLPKMLEKVQESSSALWGIGLFIQVEICARLHTKNSASIILHMPKQVPAPVLRNLKAKSRVRTRRKRQSEISQCQRKLE